MTARRVIVLILIGLLIGLFSGLFGIGGGLILVPILVYVLKFPQPIAAGTSLMAVIFPVCTAGAVYVWHGHYNLLIAALLAVGSFCGAQIGARLLRHINVQIIRSLFVVLIIFLVISLFIKIPQASHQIHLDIVTGILIVCLGLGIGILSALLGIGGGSMAVPILIAGFGMGTVVAKGTALLMIFVTIISGSIVNHKLKQVDQKTALILGISAMILAPLGAWFATLISPLISNILFVILLLGVGLRILIDIYKTHITSSKKA